MLRLFDRLPEGLEERSAPELAAHLEGPSLIHVQGLREPPLLVSVLLHGNETSGWDGVRRLLREVKPLPRSLLLFIGNVAAASAGVRTLPDQQDHNRIWRHGTGAEGEWAARLLAKLREDDLFAAVDLHNNTGRNPHYAVLTSLTDDNLALAYLFDDKAVYVRDPDTVMTRALADHCPALALELGPMADPRCADRAFDYLARCLALESLPPADRGVLRLFRTEARVHIPADVAFSFAGVDESCPLVLTGGLEGVNFHRLPAGAEFARTFMEPSRALTVLDVDHRDVTADYFLARDGRLRLQRSVIPAMYTTDPVVIRQDCLCYFMAPMSLSTVES